VSAKNKIIENNGSVIVAAEPYFLAVLDDIEELPQPVTIESRSELKPVKADCYCGAQGNAVHFHRLLMEK